MESITLKELKNRPLWLAWGMDKKNPKRPYSVLANNWKWENPKNWGDYYTVQNALTDTASMGCGFVTSALNDTTQLCFVDLDPEEGSGQISPVAREILNRFTGKTYIERSHSGKGYHIYFLCDVNALPNKHTDLYLEKNAQHKIECYTTSQRFCVLTGDKAIESYADAVLFNLTDLIIDILGEYFNKGTSVTNTKERVLQQARTAKNGDRFTALFDNGDISLYDNDDSKADLALCEMLAFHCDCDPVLISALFRDSALYRDKWDRQDYRERTIQRAISTATENKNIEYRPPQPLKEKKEMLTLSLFRDWLKENNIRVRYNQLTHNVEIVMEDDGDIYDPQKEKTKSVFIHDRLKQEYKCTLTEIENDIQAVATFDKYNPILELLSDPVRTAEYQAHKQVNTPDPFTVLCDNIMRLPEEDTLSRIFIKRWLIQTRQVWGNTERGKFNLISPNGMLVLNGGQGIGKTMLVRMLGFFDTTLYRVGAVINPNEKDTIIQATQYAITEWGEIESTFRKDIESLKAFITQNVDEYRKSYDRKAVAYPRTTAFIGTCNNDRFLIDATGNRRYWVIPCENKFDIDAMLTYDTFALWKQVEEWIADGEPFEFTDEEKELMNERNAQYNKLVKGQQEIIDIFEMAERDPDHYQWRMATASEFKEQWNTLRSYSAMQIGTALKAEGHERKNFVVVDKDGTKKKTKGYYCPFLCVINNTQERGGYFINNQ